MENSVDALKMAFAVFMFIVALSIIFPLLTKTKDTADVILFYSDKTNYYDWEEGSTEKGRTVGKDTIISALYSQAKEDVFIKIEDGSNVTLFTPTSKNEDRTTYIKEKLNTGEENEYVEHIVEITTGGMFRTAEDGTRLHVQGTKKTRTYIIYTKI